MGCETRPTPTGYAIICGRRPPKAAPCWQCPNPHRFLCDGPGPNGRGECNRRLCAEHRSTAGAGVDYCDEHANVLRLL